ncbi:MAG: FtsX-like permease family protein [Acidobacteriota bacterium]
MKLELFVAFRYLRARRKQAVISVVTLISIAGIAAGVAALNIALALNNGMQQEFRDRILGATPHVTLVRFDHITISNYDQLGEELEEISEVTAVSPTIYGHVLLRSELRQQPAVLKGLDPANSGAIQEIASKVIEGSLQNFQKGRPVPPIVLGKDLAYQLGTLQGETIQAIGLQGELSPLGRAPRVRNFEVVAIFESGLWEYDSNWALIPISSAQDFFGLSANEVSALEFRIRDIEQARQVAEKIEERAGSGYTTSTWIELNRPFFEALRLERMALFIAIGLIVLVASMNSVSTLTLMVMEKSRDISIITAMGGTSNTIMGIFMLQGLIIGVLGTILGNILGSFGAWYFDAYQVFRIEEQVYSISYVPFRLAITDLLLISLFAVLISFVATLYPARAASRIDPVEGLRYE